jgi:hypothetical protein
MRGRLFAIRFGSWSPSSSPQSAHMEFASCLSIAMASVRAISFVMVSCQSSSSAQRKRFLIFSVVAAAQNADGGVLI